MPFWSWPCTYFPNWNIFLLSFHGDCPMPILKSLTFMSLPTRSHDPGAGRRAKLVSRLEEQRQLLQDPSYVRVVQRWTGKGDERRQVEKKQRVRPWWRADAGGKIVMCIYHGTKPV